MTILALLRYLLTPAGIGALISLVAEYWPGWDSLPKRQKAIVITLATTVIPLLSWAVIEYVPPALWQRLDQPAQVLYTGVTILITYLASQATHALAR